MVVGHGFLIAVGLDPCVLVCACVLCSACGSKIHSFIQTRRHSGKGEGEQNSHRYRERDVSNAIDPPDQPTYLHGAGEPAWLAAGAACGGVFANLAITPGTRGPRSRQERLRCP